jgi:hypothetical protein
MDDLTFSARRARASAPVKTAEPADLETRFRGCAPASCDT